jgi:hypothetical protein
MTTKMRESQSHVARQLLDAAQQLKALLPKTVVKGIVARGRATNLPVPFLEQCAVFFDENPAIAQRLNVTSDEIRTVIARNGALGPVVAAIEPMAKELSAVLRTDRAIIGKACLKAYDYARSSGRALGDQNLAEQAVRMSAALYKHAKRGGRQRPANGSKTTSTTTTTTTESSGTAA